MGHKNPRFRAKPRVSLSHQEIHRELWERDRIGVDFWRSRGNCIWVYLGCSWIARSEKERNCQRFCEAAAMSSWTVQQAQLPYAARADSLLDCKSSSSSSSTTIWRRRGRSIRRSLLLRVFCATAIPLYPSPTFAANRTSSQSARDRNSRGGTQRSLQLLAFFCYSSLRVCLLPSSLTVLCGFLCDQTKWFEGKFFCSSWTWDR